MAKVTIGKVEYDLPELNFKAIKKIWPKVEHIQDSDDLIKLMDVSTEVLEIAFERAEVKLTKEEIEENLLGSEIKGIEAAVTDLLVESGLLQRAAPPGEAPGAEESPSTATGTE